MTMPSASALERSFACPASAVLERLPDVPSAAAKRGQSLHAKYQKDVPSEFAELLGGDVIAELALAYDVEADKARVIGRDVGRNYGEVLPSEVAMSLDMVGSKGIVEIKTGHPH